MAQAIDTAVQIIEQTVQIPTYPVHAPNLNPMFLDKRVYQGSSGRVYPFPVIEGIEETCELRPYTVVTLENEYLHIEVLPQLGGRIFRALDKTNQFDFVYHNHVIKPALVGLAGPWVSGGIEFNWPQHHRPDTFHPISHLLQEYPDGSKTLWMIDLDRINGTRCTVGLTLRPGKAYLEVHAQVYNPTITPQSFLWWANPAFAVNDHTRTVFPPDVFAVFDHGKRDVSHFPIARGRYYKTDYSRGVDISVHENIPVPTSYMADHSEFDFLGGYDDGRRTGLLIIANHHLSPGKKQWTWGTGDFGAAWDRNLTDADGPYVELMAGVFTDNQPDFTWLQPGEEKRFSQFFMPYKGVDRVHNASIDAVLGVDVQEGGRRVTVSLYATGVLHNAIVELFSVDGDKPLATKEVSLTPHASLSWTIDVPGPLQGVDLGARVVSSSGALLVCYRPVQSQQTGLPTAQPTMPKPQDMRSTEELYLAGLHLEQYRHASFGPDDYYLEGLNRDLSDSRLQMAYGRLLLRRGEAARAEEHLRVAIATLTQFNPNPYNGEPHYLLGQALRAQGKSTEAFAAFYKAVWTAAWQDSGYFALAQLTSTSGDFNEALALVGKALERNPHFYEAQLLQSALLRRMGQLARAEQAARATLLQDPMDFGAHAELHWLATSNCDMDARIKSQDQLSALLGNHLHNALYLTEQYATAGLFDEAVNITQLWLLTQSSPQPLALYAIGYCLRRAGRAKEGLSYYERGALASSDYCFPNTLFHLAILEDVTSARPKDGRAWYYKGNLLYDKGRQKEATDCWQLGAELCPDFPIPHRNLALAKWNSKEIQIALMHLQTAWNLNPTDARVLYEFDLLQSLTGTSPEDRLVGLESYLSLVKQRDDLSCEYAVLLNTVGRHDEALSWLLSRRFHPWEGGEGKVTRQYVLARVEIAKRLKSSGRFVEARVTLERALKVPDNLGEGVLPGTPFCQVHYELGQCARALGDDSRADAEWEKAASGDQELGGARYYNDLPPEEAFYQSLALCELKKNQEANDRFRAMISYGETHMNDPVEPDYFAVSLPDFSFFEQDPAVTHQSHCLYLIGLGYIGLENYDKARQVLDRVLSLNPGHQGARLHRPG